MCRRAHSEAGQLVSRTVQRWHWPTSCPPLSCPRAGYWAGLAIRWLLLPGSAPVAGWSERAFDIDDAIEKLAEGRQVTADDCSEGIRAVTATEVTFSERRRRLKFFLRLGFLVFNLIIILPGKKHPSFLDAIRLRYSYSYHWYESKESHNFKLRLVIQFIEKKWLELENR